MLRTVDPFGQGNGPGHSLDLHPPHLLSIAPAALPVVACIRADRGTVPQ